MQQIPGCFVPMHTCIDNQIHAFCRNTTKRRMQSSNGKTNRTIWKNYEQLRALHMLKDAYNPPARKIIHIVSPIVNDKLTHELEKSLPDCYTNNLNIVCRK